MNKNSNNRRSRGRGGNKRHGNVRNQTFESNGPGVKVRGSAQQVLDKYLALARDASSSGDRIMAESYFQFAEHYFRLLNTDEQRNADRNGANRGRNDRDRANTPGSAEGGPDDQMSGGYDNDGDSDGDDSSGDNDAEVIRTDRPQAQNDSDDADNAENGKGDRENSRNASSGGETKGRGRSRNARNSGGGDNDDAEQAPAPRPRGRRKKPAVEGDNGAEAQPDLLSEPKADAPVENDAAD